MEHVSRTTKYWLPWLVGMPAETATAICCLIMGNVFAQFPKLKFCFAHGGGSFPFTVGRIQHGLNDLSFLQPFKIIIIKLWWKLKAMMFDLIYAQQIVQLHQKNS